MPDFGCAERNAHGEEVRCRGVREFTILYLRGSVLERAEQVRAADAVEAVRIAAGQQPDTAIEVWANGRKVAIVRANASS